MLPSRIQSVVHRYPDYAALRLRFDSGADKGDQRD